MTKVKEKDEHGRILFDSWDEVPAFESEAEEQAWWERHAPSEKLLETFKRVAEEERAAYGLPPSRVSGKISLRLEQDILKRLKALAAKKGMGYQALLKTFVAERLYEEEKREGMI
jgi:predicted DNA binding CopG/RHH family protein